MADSSARTLPIIDSVVERLKEKLPNVAAEYFPEEPKNYRLNHPVGALLVSFPGSVFGLPPASGQNAAQLPGRVRPQEREVGLRITVVLRQLNGRNGAIDVLDDVRDALRGFRPPGCRSDLAYLGEQFLGQLDGLWQYALDARTTTWDGAAAQRNL